MFSNEESIDLRDTMLAIRQLQKTLERIPSKDRTKSTYMEYLMELHGLHDRMEYLLRNVVKV